MRPTTAQTAQLGVFYAGVPEAKANYIIFGFSWPDVSERNFRGGTLLLLSRGVTSIGHVDSAALCSCFAWGLGSFRSCVALLEAFRAAQEIVDK